MHNQPNCLLAHSLLLLLLFWPNFFQMPFNSFKPQIAPKLPVGSQELIIIMKNVCFGEYNC